MNDEDNQNSTAQSHGSTSTKSGATEIHDFVKKGIDFVAATAAQAVEAVQEVSDRLTTGTTVRLEQAVGRDAEVSAPIAVGGTGEVIFSLGGATQHCPARALDGRRSFKKGTKVKIAETTNQLVFIE
jgi:hypothetical protein